MTVRGDVEPTTLVQKLTRWGKKAELVSVNYQLDDDDLLSDSEEDFNDDDEDEQVEWVPDPKPMERVTLKKKKKGILSKSSLLGCFSRKPPEVVLPFPTQNRNQQRMFPPMQPQQRPPPFGTMYPQQRPQYGMMNHQPMMQQQPHPRMRQQQPQGPMMNMMMQQQPQGPMPMGYNGNMFQPTRPYFLKDLKANPSLHYQKS
ncbi:unnamed protein product [Microthlaspi erraticum]|nr:unnamed protein product [Microthlaspi erraticum]